VKLLQMRYLCEIARCRFNFSEVARRLHTSQPGISRQIQALESELGFPILSRNGKRIVGLTRQGEAVLEVAKRMESDTEGLRRLSKDHLSRLRGHLTVATTSFHARYTLLDAVLKFRQSHPQVSLSLHQSDPLEIARQVAMDEADVGISVEAQRSDQDVAAIPCHIPHQAGERVLITSVGHPLLKVRKLTLALIAGHPMIMYDPKLSVGSRVMHTFEQKALAPEIALTATEPDVIKAYVAAGLGIAVVQQAVFDPKRDRKLRAIDVSHLFETGKTVLMLRRRNGLSELVSDFIGIVAPSLDPAAVRRALARPPAVDSA
jgi:LysR family cys regulon transcriptional activator